MRQVAFVAEAGVNANCRQRIEQVILGIHVYVVLMQRGERSAQSNNRMRLLLTHPFPNMNDVEGRSRENGAKAEKQSGAGRPCLLEHNAARARISSACPPQKGGGSRVVLAL